MLKVSKRGLVPPFIVMDVMRAAHEREAEGDHVLHLEVGQPSTAAPAAVLAAAANSLVSDVNGYTDALGVPALRRRIAKHYGEFYNCPIDPEHVVVTTGSSGAFLLSFLSAFDPGDKVALASPGYPAYRNILEALGITPVEIQVDASTRFQPTVELLENLAAPVDGLIVASPSNPTGCMVPAETFADIINWCSETGTRLVSDEIYHGITYGAAPNTALQFTEDALVINSFSKYFSMTGWRLGWMIVPNDLLRSVECLSQNFFISPPAVSQNSALAAFECPDELNANVTRYAENRRLLLDRLPKAGFTRLAPSDGAFYLYADISDLTNDSREFCRRMLTEVGIAATPGIDFDRLEGHRFMRFSFSGSTEDMAAAADRLTNWLKP